MTAPTEDERWMRLAVAQAKRAQALGEVPVGAVLVADGRVVGSGFNQPITALDATAHAEVVALRAAAQVLANYRMPGTTLYVTLEPCMMCAGAMVHARVERLVYGAVEPKAGVVESHPLLHSNWFNHRVEVTSGVMAQTCGALLSDFFSARRKLRSSAGE